MVGIDPANAFVANARVKKTRLTPIQWCRDELQRWSTPKRPRKERAANARTWSRCSPTRLRISRGRTFTETVLLDVWPVVAR
jgi:hypothetical protein